MGPAPTSAGPAPTGGGGFSLALDGEGVILFIAFCVLVGAFILAGGYLVYEAPVILAETLFEFSLASLLLKKLKREEQGDWLGHLFKLTWKPFAGGLVVTLIFAALVASLRPHAERLPDLWAEKPAVTE